MQKPVRRAVNLGVVLLLLVAVIKFAALPDCVKLQSGVVDALFPKIIRLVSMNLEKFSDQKCLLLVNGGHCAGLWLLQNHYCIVGRCIAAHHKVQRPILDM